MRPTRVIIDLNRLRNNIKEIRSVIKEKTSIMAVVKANAYGHGLVQIAKCAAESGVEWLGVALPEEGMELRKSGISLPILVLGDASREQCEISVRYDLTQAVPSLITAHHLNDIALNSGKKAKVHIKLDTGMGRIGFNSVKELKTVVKEMQNMQGISIEGVFTHLATADEENSDYTIKQINCMEKMLEEIKESGLQIDCIHVSNSAGILMYPQSHYNMVRCGISMYGYFPSTFVKERTGIALKPIMQWETRILFIKTLETGSSVSYGRSFIASSPRKVATLPVGYADGYKRLFGNRASVLIRGRRAPVIGRVCMDQIMVDITDIPEAEIGDQVVLLGEQGNEKITADELADLCGTISYEILASISDRVPRIYKEG